MSQVFIHLAGLGECGFLLRTRFFDRHRSYFHDVLVAMYVLAYFPTMVGVLLPVLVNKYKHIDANHKPTHYLDWFNGI